jgi:acetolactate synthase-1/2/3 large subunit
MKVLRGLGYSHCFFVAGGNSMHLLDAARSSMKCIPFVHEVSASIAAEYFNEVATGSVSRAFVLVTAGPGITNAVTGVAGAFLESRELLVIGGQVKTSDLATSGLRQRGIQEIDGVALTAPISKMSIRLESPIVGQPLVDLLQSVSTGRPGPVFLEICLDVQGQKVNSIPDDTSSAKPLPGPGENDLARVAEILASAQRPVLLIGGGFHRRNVEELERFLEIVEIPVMTTWNGADRISSVHELYFGRPNTWGQRSSNIILQQADVILALGTRLGLQQTGFNWKEFAPKSCVIQVDIDEAELKKGHPRIDLAICADANVVLNSLHRMGRRSWPDWTSFAQHVRNLLPLSESSNRQNPNFLNTFDFVLELSEHTDERDIVVPCSSGGAFTVMMQAFQQKAGQRIVTNKGLASMGYGLAGAIGASLAAPERRVVLVEGDGGFSQNLQELATVSRNRLNLKIFLFINNGYASIRMTQLNYFRGEYLGCDEESGLGFPNWERLAATYQMECIRMNSELWENDSVLKAWESTRPVIFLVPVDPEQTYFPKIASKVRGDGSMVSSPLHEMSPELNDELTREVFRYL